MSEENLTINNSELTPKKKPTFGVAQPKRSNKATKVAVAAVAGVMALAAIAVPTVIHFSGNRGAGKDFWTVTINYGEVGANKTLTVKAGDKVSQITPEAIPGYYFAGYCEDSGLTKYIDPDSVITENKTIYLNYIAIKYSFEKIPEDIKITTIDGQEEITVTEETKLLYNQDVSLAYTVKAGHHLTNLKITGLEQVTDLAVTNNDNGSTTYTADYKVKGFAADNEREVNLGLSYSQDVNIYTLTFNNDGAITTQSVAYNELAQTVSNPTKAEDEQYTYSFKGWTLDHKATEDSPLVDLNSFHITENTTLYAVYTKTLRTYYINLDSSYPTECVVISRLENNNWVELKHDAALHYGDFITVTYAPTLGHSVVEASTGVRSGVKVGIVDKDGNEMYMVTGNVVIAYEEQVTKFTVTYLNEDGTTLATVSTAEYGNSIAALYTGTTPTKASTQDEHNTYTYTFSGWSATTVEGDITVTPVFTMTSVAREYTIVEIPADVTVEFVSGTSNHKAGDKLTTASKLHYGDEIKVRYAFATGLQLQSFVVKGITESESTGTSVGSVSGYIQGTITGEVTITCANEQTTYNVIYLNADGSVLLLTTAKHGASVVDTYTGEIPTKASTQDERNIYTYTFSGWSTSTITENNMQITPNFTTTTVARKFVVTYLDEAGTTLATVSTAEYGNNIATLYTGTTPTKASTQDERNTYTYTFSGWSATTVEGDTTVTPIFTMSSVAREYTIAEIPADVTVEFVSGTSSHKAGDKLTTASKLHYGDEIKVSYAFATGLQLQSFVVKGITESESTGTSVGSVSGYIQGTITGEVTITCANEQTTYNVIYLNADGSVLLLTTAKHGASVVETYTGEIPTKASTQDERNIYTYTFSGWSTSTITENNMQITPNFTTTTVARKFVITYLDEAGTTLATVSTAEYGNNIATLYTGTTPTKASTQDERNTYTYTFSGWSATTVEGDTTVTPVFTSTTTAREYSIAEIPADVTVEFVSGTSNHKAGDKLTTASKLHYGDEIKVRYAFATGLQLQSFVVKGITESESTGTSVGSVSGYIQGTITGEVTITCANEQTTYNVIYLNADGSVLLLTTAKHGASVVETYTGETPTKASAQDERNIYTYTFSGWSTSTITENNMQITPNFTTTTVARKFVVTYLDEAGTTLATVSTAEYGNNIASLYTGTTPSKASTQDERNTYTYTFTGWSATTVEGDTTVTPVFTTATVARNYTITTNKTIGGNGSLTVFNKTQNKTTTNAHYGDELTITYKTSAGYKMENFNIQGIEILNRTTSGNTTTISCKVMGAVTVTYEEVQVNYVVNFDENHLTVTVNGTAISSGSTVTYGTKLAISYTESAGHTKQSIKVNGKEITTSYTVTDEFDSINIIYSETINKVTIKYYDYDGTLLETTQVNWGTTATRANPTRAADNTYTYTFNKWVTSRGGTTPANLNGVIANTSVYASYNQTYISYKITSIPSGVRVTYVSGTSGYSSNYTLSTSSSFHYGDTLKVSYTSTTGKKMTSFSVNGITSSSTSGTSAGNTSGYIQGYVRGNLTLGYSEDYIEYTLSSIPEHVTVTYISGTSANEANSVLTTSSTYHYGDILKISYQVEEEGYAKSTFSISNLTTTESSTDDTTAGYIQGRVTGTISISYTEQYYLNFSSVTGGYSVSGLRVSSVTDVIIPEIYNGQPVVGISSYAFQNKSALKSVQIPDSVTSIGNQAFYGCSVLTDVNIPNAITSIGSSAFYNCSSITSLTIPEGVTSIGQSAFYNCKALEIVNYNATAVTDFSSNSNVFYNAGVNSEGIAVTFGESVTKIPAYLFYVNSASYTPKITSAIIGSSVTSIGSSAFYNCSIITDITIPESVTSIGSYAFYNCSSITDITIPESVTSIGSSAFYNCRNLTAIQFNAVACNDLSSSNDVFSYAGQDGEGIIVTFGESVTKIPAYLFYPYSNSSYAPKIINVIIGNNVISIGNYAFYNCSSITSITIPEGVTSIGDYAFNNCTALTKINFNATNCANFTSSSRIFYNAGTNGEGITVSFGDNVTKIPAYLFYSAKIVNVTMDASVTSIGSSAFQYCTSLTSITIPEGVTSIGSSAFYGCSSLTSITIPEGATSVGGSAFYGCSSLTSITIPEGVTSIGGSAFYGCTELTEINFNATNCADFTSSSRIFYNAGTNGEGITVAFGDNVAKIPAYLFAVNDGTTSYKITNVIIGKNITSIGSSAFYNCGILTEVTINSESIYKSVTSEYSCNYLVYHAKNINVLKNIDDNSNTYLSGNSYKLYNNKDGYNTYSKATYGIDEQGFMYNEISGGLSVIGYQGKNTNLTIPSSYNGLPVVNIAKGAFTTVKSLIIPESVTSISDDSFSQCQSLKSITLPNSVTHIGQRAFFGCRSLTSITIPESVEKIDYGAFYGCYYLEVIYFNAKNCNIVYPGKDTIKVFDGVGNYGKGVTLIFGNNVETIPANMFYGSNAKINEVIISSSVTSIGGNAFSGCTNLTAVTIESDNAYKNATSTTNCGYLLQNATTVKVLKTVADKEGNTNTYLNGTGFTRTEEGDYYVYTKN